MEFKKTHYPIKIDSSEYTNVIKICIHCIDKCNYKCEYCYNMKDNYIRTNIEINLDKVLLYIKFLKKKYFNYKFKIILIGGEPTLHKNYLSFIKKIYKLDNISLYSFTNFSQPISFYIECAKYNVNFLISFHYLNQYRTNLFIKKILELKSKTIAIASIHIMLHTKYYFECLNIYDRLFKIFNNNVECNLIDDYDKTKFNKIRHEKYTSIELNEYNKRLLQYNNFDCDKHISVYYNDNSICNMSEIQVKNDITFNFKKWICNAGLTYFYVHFNGNIFPCADMLYKNIGNIYNLYMLKFSKTLCMSNGCPCEFGLPKENVFKLINLNI